MSDVICLVYLCNMLNYMNHFMSFSISYSVGYTRFCLILVHHSSGSD